MSTTSSGSSDGESRKLLGDRYELLELLGSGGFGLVYKARQLHTGQLVAVKSMRAALLDSKDGHLHLARFRREMALCSRLHHPNIVRLVDSLTEDDTLYAVFSFVPGKTLSELLTEEGRLSPALTKHLMLQVLDALAAAHKMGVIHRDLKPQNIMVTTTGARQNVQILDFGVGTFVDPSDVEAITRVGERLGTPSYASPEQLNGLPPDPRSDLYAWGLVMMECLTGQRVMSGNTLAEILQKQLSSQPVPLPAPLRGHPLGDIIGRALEKQQLNRPDAALLLDQLQKCDVSTLSFDEPLAPIKQQSTSDTFMIRDATEDPGAPDPDHLLDSSSAPLDASQDTAWERRQVTVLCLGFEAREHTEPERYDASLRALHAIAAELATQHQGHISSVLGEQVLMVFGYPSAQEGDVARAGRAALAAIERVSSSRHGSARIGMHSGLVVVRRIDTPGRRHALEVIGQAVNIATRLQRMCEDNTIQLSEDSRRLLGERFHMEPLSKRRLPGFPDEVGVYQLLTERSSGVSSTFGLTDRAMVGREDELSSLLRRWARARDGQGTSLLLQGEPGLGKSRLLGELRRRIRSDVHIWLDMRCAQEDSSSAMRPVIDALNRWFAFARGWSDPQKLNAMQSRLQTLGLDLATTVPFLANLLSVDLGQTYPPLMLPPHQLKAQLFQHLTTLFSELADRSPMLLIVEDLQWSDPTTLEFLGGLLPELSGTAICALLTARLEFVPTWSSGPDRQQLGRLSEAAVRDMVGLLAGPTALPGSVVDQIVARTEGIPLFVEAMVAILQEPGADIDKVPATLRELLTARLDTAAQARATAQCAAVLGQEFPLEWLLSLSLQSEAEVRADLDQLGHLGLMRQRRRARGTRLLFHHGLLRDAAYESIRAEDRVALHSRAAAMLEASFPELLQTRPDLLAHHHAAAEQRQQAIGYALAATGQALMRSANAEAVAHGGRALSWLEAIGDERERATMELNINGMMTPALMATRGYGAPEVLERVERSQALIDVLGDVPQIFPTLWALIFFYMVQNQRQRAGALIERFLALAVSSGDTSRQVVGQMMLGQHAFNDGRLSDAREPLERSLALYDPGQHAGHAFEYGFDTRANAHALLANTLLLMGRDEEAEVQAQSALTWARELIHAQTLSGILFGLGCFYHYARRPEQVIEVTDQLRAVAQEFDVTINLTFGEVLRGWADGDLAAAQKALGMLQMMGINASMSYWESLVAELEAAAGDTAGALARIDRCLERSGVLDGDFYTAELKRLKGSLLRTLGEEERAQTMFSEAVAHAEAQGATLFADRAAAAARKTNFKSVD